MTEVGSAFILDQADAVFSAAHYLCASGGGKSKTLYDAIFAYKRPSDGRIVWLHAAGRVVRGEDDKARYMYGVYQDITEFKLLERDIVAARPSSTAWSRRLFWAEGAWASSRRRSGSMTSPQVASSLVAASWSA